MMSTTGATVISAGDTSVGDLNGTETRVAARKVVIINGRTNILEVVETALDAGSYDIVFVESYAHAYSQIKRIQPNLVILCLGIDDISGFQVLSMLTLDEETRRIPVLTYMAEPDGQEADDQEPEPSDSEISIPRPALRMN
jgi:PleD family two-component response regulator